MTSIMDSKEGFERLKKALIEIDENLADGEICVPITKVLKPNKKLELWEAKNSKSEELEIKKASGRISTSMVCLYPPGAPVIVPGEEITEEAVSIIISSMNEGIHVTGLNNGRICVVK